jgi:hypothetical protein
VLGLSNIPPELALDPAARTVIDLLASGGDERIVLDPRTGLNRYYSSPYPRAITAYASSTANDLSPAAFAHVRELAAAPRASYDERLERLRARIRAAYRLPDDSAIVFAPSGTDLEYVALAAVAGRAGEGIHNVLLGADEVGSGCRLSAHGMYFAATTVRGVPTVPGTTVAGLEHVSMVDVPVRSASGLARSSEAVAADILFEIRNARAAGRHALVHVVHGSKTGMILPQPIELDSIEDDEAGSFSLVVDACQGRITTEAVHDYLERGAIVFLTGSKFMGGPPFSGFAVIPRQLAERAGPLPAGLVDVFRRAEWPERWPGREQLATEDNPGLWLRLEASVFELERFQALPLEAIERIVGAFDEALDHEIVAKLGVARVDPHALGREGQVRAHPIEMRTLATLDISGLPGVRMFDEAQALHHRLALAGLRLGQPVRSVRTADGEWAGTLRVGLSMPQLVAWSQLTDAALREELSRGMAEIADALRGLRREKAA